MEKLREKMDSTRIIIITGALYLISQAAIGMILQPVGIGPFMRLQTSLSEDAVSSIINEWYQADIARFYLQHFYLDFLHPLWYSLFLVSCMSKIFNIQSLPGKWNYLLLLPFIAGIFDLIENILHLLFFSNRENITPFLACLSGTASIAKWAAAGLCTLFIFLYTAKWLTQKNKF